MAARGDFEGPTLIRWGPVIAGAVIGFGLMVLFSAFWVALGEGTGVQAISDNLHWYGFITAIVALTVAGFVAGWLSGVRGVGPGMFHGLTVWAIVLVGTIAVGLPATLQVFEGFAGPLPQIGAEPMWASFLGLTLGLVVAVLGGIAGGGITRPAWMYAPRTSADRPTAVREEPRLARASGDYEERDVPRGRDR